MRGASLLALLATLVPAGQVYAQAVDISRIGARRGLTWDAQLEGGWTLRDEPDVDLRAFGRARAGLLIVRDPWYYAIGPTVTVGGLNELGFGAQLEATNFLNAWWMQLGAEYSPEYEQVVAHLGLGWNILGVEWQRSAMTEPRWAILLKLRIPIGIAASRILNDPPPDQSAKAKAARRP